MKITTSFTIFRVFGASGHMATSDGSKDMSRPDGHAHVDIARVLCRIKRMEPCDLLVRMDDWRPLDIHPDNAAWDGTCIA